MLSASSSFICAPLLYEWSLCGCFCAFILSLSPAGYLSWLMASWGRRGEGCRPRGFSSEQLLRVFSIFFLCFFLHHSFCQDCFPSRLQRNWDEAENVQNADETGCEGSMFWFKATSDLMAAPPWVHLVALSSWMSLFDVSTQDLFHSSVREHEAHFGELLFHSEESYSRALGL